MIELSSYGRCPSEARLKCDVAEVLLADESISTDIKIQVLKCIGVSVKKINKNNETDD